MYNLKYFKTSPDYIYQKSFNKLIICDINYCSENMQRLLNDPGHYLSTKARHLYKNTRGSPTKVGVVNIDGFSLVIKRYNIKNFWHGVKLKLKPSRAFKSWRNSHYLLKHNIPTVPPVALIEKRFGIFRSVAYFITEHVHADILGSHFSSILAPGDFWQQETDELIKILEKLRDTRIAHGDLNPRNILMHKHMPLLVDLDHMRIKFYSDKTFWRHYWRDIDHVIGKESNIHSYVKKRIKQALNVPDDIPSS